MFSTTREQLYYYRQSMVFVSAHSTRKAILSAGVGTEGAILIFAIDSL